MDKIKEIQKILKDEFYFVTGIDEVLDEVAQQIANLFPDNPRCRWTGECVYKVLKDIEDANK